MLFPLEILESRELGAGNGRYGEAVRNARQVTVSIVINKVFNQEVFAQCRSES